MLTAVKEMPEKSKETDTSSIDLLIDALAGDDIKNRRQALGTLIRRGAIAVNALAELLKSHNEHVRWEAAKALGKIGGNESAEALVDALDDDSLDVRWLAADGLIAMGDDSLVPLLHGLISHSDSSFVREASAHVLHTLLDKEHADVVVQVLSALGTGIPTEEVPVAAYEALNRLRGMAVQRPS